MPLTELCPLLGMPSPQPFVRGASLIAFRTQLQHHLFVEALTLEPQPRVCLPLSVGLSTLSSSELRGQTQTHIHGPMSSLDFINSFFKINKLHNVCLLACMTVCNYLLLIVIVCFLGGTGHRARGQQATKK